MFLTKETLTHLSQIVEQNFGLFFPEDRHKDLERAMGYAAHDLDFADTKEYVDWLLHQAGEQERQELLTKYLTIGETYFFRDSKIFTGLSMELIPAILGEKIKSPEKVIRIWSAACSTGEEPYSIAIALAQISLTLKEWDITIFGTDLNKDSITKAKAALYSDWSFRDVPERVRQTYFHKQDKKYALSSQIKNKVTFDRVNLAFDDFPPLPHTTAQMDIIFCRNVLIYFEQTKRNKIVSKLTKCLSDTGILITSPSELSLITQPGLQIRRLKCGASIFKKTSVPAKKSCSPELTQTVEPSTKPLKPVGILRSQLPKTDSKKDPACKNYLAEFEKGNYEKITNELVPLIDNNKQCGDLTEIEAIALVAETYANMGLYEEALKWGNRIIALDNITPAHHFFLATIYIELGRNQEASDSLKKSIFLDSNFVMAYFTLATISPPESAEKHFKTVISILEQTESSRIIPFSEGMSAGHLLEISSTMALNSRQNQATG